MIFTNAVGGLSPRLAIGDVMLVSEVIDLTFQGDLGIHMPPSRQSDVIDRQWRELIRSTATMRSIRFEEGTYLQVLGPSYETRAEIRMARRFHADVIGMSTAREAKAAAAFGLRVCTLSVVTNRLSDVRTPTLDHAEVVDAGKRAAPVLHNMLSTAIFAL
jgi:purine-nucleoside phosphorylase